MLDECKKTQMIPNFKSTLKVLKKLKVILRWIVQQRSRYFIKKWKNSLLQEMALKHQNIPLNMTLTYKPNFKSLKMCVCSKVSFPPTQHCYFQVAKVYAKYIVLYRSLPAHSWCMCALLMSQSFANQSFLNRSIYLNLGKCSVINFYAPIA